MRKNTELERNVGYVVEAFSSGKDLSRKVLMKLLGKQMRQQGYNPRNVPNEAEETIRFAIKTSLIYSRVINLNIFKNVAPKAFRRAISLVFCFTI